ncbi:MAG: cytochrome-c peroxidase [Pyrinomonadaceae bacterium]|nr:cytochrome-c peroxidase [Sphingobacteriaceae bacterium]
MFKHFLLICFVSLSTISCKRSLNNSEKVREYYYSKITKSDTLSRQFLRAVSLNESEASIQNKFKEARLAFKEAEFLAEYYSPLTAKSINGAPIPEIDVDDQHKISDPEGFQVIEAFIFPNYTTENKKNLLEEAQRLVSNHSRLKTVAETNSFIDDHIFDALRLEVFRIITLGISGFDAPIAQNSMLEARVSLLSMLNILSIYKGDMDKADAQLYKSTEILFENAANYLSKNKDFNTFNRMEFILKYANPISSVIAKTARTLHIKPVSGLRALNANSTNLFEKDAFNADYFAPNQEAHTSKEKEKLGNLLFFDPVLSGTGNRSCASCHQPEKAFTDGLAKNTTIAGNKLIKRNTPTVLNAGLQPGLFYDIRVSFLEDQATEVIKNPDEMHGSLDKAVKRLNQSGEYGMLFKKAYPNSTTPLNEYNLRNSIASYIRSLSSLNSKFDNYMRGDSKQLSLKEINGFNLYMGKGKCGTCHFMPLFNGTVPPNFVKTETEVIGVPVSASTNSIDSDPGRFNLRHIPLHKNAFRTPTVRNIALTAPYMHNGIYNSLEVVINFYNEGGGAGLGIELQNQTLPFDKLKLSSQEKKDIITFLNTLTDNSKAKSTPKELPSLGLGGKNRSITSNY